MTLEIVARWRSAQTPRERPTFDPVDESSFDELATCVLRVSVGGDLLTEMTDHRQQLQDGPCVSAFRFAEWLLWNWWRIRWEPRTDDPTLSWRQAHEMASIGGGWLWPRLTFESDGRSVAVRSKGSEATVTEPVSYLAETEERFVSADVFENTIDSFLQDVMSRVRESGLASNPVAEMWRELKAERDDPILTDYRRLEALLGHDPDEGDADAINRLILDRAMLGEQAAEEVAANAALTRMAPTTADCLADAAKRSGYEISDRDGAASTIDNRVALTDYEAPLVPWRIGVDAAKQLRRSEGLDDRPITDRRLCEMCGLPGGVFRKSGTADLGMAYTLSSETSHRIVFRARAPTGRRFDAARILGDRLVVRNGEPLQPATGARTFRQKMQRAFAAEFLCPFDALLERLGGDRSEEAMEDAATKFRVSPMLVARRLGSGLPGAAE